VAIKEEPITNLIKEAPPEDIDTTEVEVGDEVDVLIANLRK